MRTDTLHLGAIQNIGMWERIFRVIIGVALIAVVLVDLYRMVEIGWHAYLPLLAIYPILTGFLGVDPFYSSLGFRTCDTSRRNRCGTFPFQVEAAAGKDVKCDADDCSLSGDHSVHEHGKASHK